MLNVNKQFMKDLGIAKDLSMYHKHKEANDIMNTWTTKATTPDEKLILLNFDKKNINCSCLI